MAEYQNDIAPQLQGKPAGDVHAVARRHWQQLVDALCRDQQADTASVLRTEGMLQALLEASVIDTATLGQWGEEAARRLAAAIPNPLWPGSVITVEDGSVHIVLLQQRAPVYPSGRG
jgi:hypothetical protein